MKILMLVNWKLKYCDSKPNDKQPPDYCVKNEDYWFYRHFKDKPEVDVVDVSSFEWLENFEKNKIRFYVYQALRVLPKLNKYDLIVSHGMQSGIVIALLRKLFKTKAKHIVFDIGSFASASESGFSLKLMQFASRSIDGLLYHTKWQYSYYEKFFPWLLAKSYFVRFGADFDYFNNLKEDRSSSENYILCIGKNLTRWKELYEAYRKSGVSCSLKLVGGYDEDLKDKPGVMVYPFIPIKELVKLINGARFCVLPLENVKFSFGQTRLLQQMSMGKCVIASDIRSFEGYFEDGVTAFGYSPGDIEKLSGLIKYLDMNQAVIDAVGKNAKLFCRDVLNERVMALEIEKVYKDVFNGTAEE